MANESKVRTSAVQSLVERCGGDLWGECEQFRKTDWRDEVAAEDTILGYWEWVLAEADSRGVTLETLTGR